MGFPLHTHPSFLHAAPSLCVNCEWLVLCPSTFHTAIKLLAWINRIYCNTQWWIKSISLMVTKKHMLHQYHWPISAAIKIPVNSPYHVLISIAHVHLLLHTPSFLPILKLSWGEEGFPSFTPAVKLNTLLGAPSGRWEGRKEHLETKINHSYIDNRETHVPLKSPQPSSTQIARQHLLWGFNFRKHGLELWQILQAMATTKI